ncbi:hypothetical protein P175DRAFT_0443165 [Aspergillus ochraceoroseus IBT 24754]|nr:uncharacterized protein P175DRAFT_0443165 [Aspergillus ochraceoroseus IBT 24754]PTU18865.1 hypothetical protein P175DRAFT_0443165 [Aspergillus ochraceoroseus IBT 24754]
MGNMDMGDGVPSLFYLQKMYWAVIGSAIGAATVVNILNRFIAFQRLRDSTLTPSKPKSLFFSTYATFTAMVREASYASLPPCTIFGHQFHFAPLGPLAIVLANVIVVIVFCFYKLDTTNQWEWEDIGYRTGFVTIAQLPMIYLLGGRQNIIGYLAGISYQRLNWFHRWVARTVWLSATFHMGFWFRSWARYDYILYQLHNDYFAKRGFAAWIILTFIVISSSRPVRRLSYEFFVIQHLVMFVGFTAAVWLHATNEVKVWVWIPIGLLVFDRVARYAWATYVNLSVFHRSSSHALWANRASFTPLPGNVTRITIENPGTRWQVGQHVFLTCHSIVPLQSHPFTIASIPEDNKMEFLVRAEKGGTRRFFRYASKHHQVLGAPDSAIPGKQTRTVFLDGPYGTSRDLRQFDSVVLLAGGMGATFTMPCLRYIVAKWKAECSPPSNQRGAPPRTRLAVTKRIRFVWVIKSRAQLSWFDSQLRTVLVDANACRRANPDLIREIEISIYITCDEKLEQPSQGTSCLPRGTAPVLPETTRVTADEKIPEKETASIHSAIPPPPSFNQGCLPNGGCCCTAAIKDEDAMQPHRCTCSGETPSQTQPNLPELTMISGRPIARTIIRKVLEKAEGESAVVVCGPQGLSDDVRRSVVSLSDERAVHKGTGAQGIYLHVENYGW